MFTRKKRRFTSIDSTIKVEMSQREFKKLILADEAMRHIDNHGLPSDQFEVELYTTDNPYGEKFSCEKQSPIYRPGRFTSIKIIHIRSQQVIWQANFIKE